MQDGYNNENEYEWNTDLANTDSANTDSADTDAVNTDSARERNMWQTEKAAPIENVQPEEVPTESTEYQSPMQKTEHDMPEYNFWSEEYQSNASVDVAGKGENGKAQYDTPQYDIPQYDAPQYDYSNASFEKEGKGKKKKKDGFGKKAFKLVVSAAVFGVVAGACFQGVNYAVDYFRPEPEIARTEPINTTIPSTTVSNGVVSAETDLTALVDNTMPAIVSITSTMTQDFSYFGQNYQEEYEGSGSGFIVGKNDDQLLVVTNNHVIEGAKAIAVTFIDEKVVEAVVKGTDTSADLAVLAINLSDISEETLGKIKIATLGDSSQVKVGQMAIAIGNALGYGQYVTVGYISAKDREVEASGGTSLALLQTDAAINPGNSGGALLNINGEVIGINSVKYADTSVEGMGYAIPISEATPIIDELMNREVLKDNEKGYLGISGKSITEENNIYNMPLGVYVYDVAQDGAAAESGILRGDIIVEVNNVTVTTIEALAEKVNSIRVGTEITITVMRNENGEYVEKEISVILKSSDSLKSLEGDTDQATESTEPTAQQMPNQQSPEQQSPEQQSPEQQVPDQQMPDGYGSDSFLEDFLRDFYQY